MRFAIDFSVESCIGCGFQFALPKSFICARKQDHKIFYCPACKCSHYWPQLSDKERLQKQLNNVQECCTFYEDRTGELQRSAVALKGHLTRKKKELASVKS